MVLTILPAIKQASMVKTGTSSIFEEELYKHFVTTITMYFEYLVHVITWKFKSKQILYIFKRFYLMRFHTPKNVNTQ